MTYDTAHQLRKEFASAGVDVSVLGEGATKRVEDLAAEIDTGESIVMVDNDTGEIVRVVEGVAVDVWADIDGLRYHLAEDRQEFANGSMRRRNLSTSLGEKLLPGESLEDAVRRALCEELGITAVRSVTYGNIERRERLSESYPGILSHITLHRADALISLAHFDPGGYSEIQPGKTTYFTWRCANDESDS